MILCTGPSHRGAMEKKPPPNWYFTEGLSEQVRQDEARGFRFHTVDPEVGAAGMILVPPVGQLEAVCLRVEGLRERDGGAVRVLPQLGSAAPGSHTPHRSGRYGSQGTCFAAN